MPVFITDRGGSIWLASYENGELRAVAGIKELPDGRCLLHDLKAEDPSGTHAVMLVNKAIMFAKTTLKAKGLVWTVKAGKHERFYTSLGARVVKRDPRLTTFEMDNELHN